MVIKFFKGNFGYSINNNSNNNYGGDNDDDDDSGGILVRFYFLHFGKVYEVKNFTIFFFYKGLRFKVLTYSFELHKGCWVLIPMV